MKQLLAISILVLFVSSIANGQACQPPAYGCDCAIPNSNSNQNPIPIPNQTCSDTVQTPAAPFNTSTPINTIVQENILSSAHIVRVTDPTTTVCLGAKNHDWHATRSGGATDVTSNTNASLLAITCNDGVTYAIEYNESALQVFPTQPSVSCIGSPGFSRTNPYIWYCKPDRGVSTPLGTANGTTVYALAFAQDMQGNHCGLGKCPDATVAPTWSKYFDFSTCPQAPATAPQSYSQLGVGTDESVSNSISWAGGQNTAHLFFDYIPGTGCTTLDTVGNGANPVWYPTGGGPPITLTSVNASFSIHDSYTVGTWAQISIGGTGNGGSSCTGSNCPASDGPPQWQVNTSNLQIIGDYPKPTGHNDFTNLSFYNVNNPLPQGRKFNDPANPVTLAGLSCDPCEDSHISADVLNDQWPIIATRGGVANQTWKAPLMSEVYSIDPTGNGTILRFAKTYSTGTTACEFECQNAISGTTQTRRSACYTSDMLGSTGTIVSAGVTLNRSDVYCVGLVGQPLLPPPTGLSASVGQSGSVTFTWTQSLGSGITKDGIDCGDINNGPYNPHWTSGTPATTATLTMASGTHYCVAVAYAGPTTISALSNQVIVTVP